MCVVRGDPWMCRYVCVTHDIPPYRMESAEIVQHCSPLLRQSMLLCAHHHPPTITTIWHWQSFIYRGGGLFLVRIISWEIFVPNEGGGIPPPPPAKSGALAVQCMCEAVHALGFARVAKFPF